LTIASDKQVNLTTTDPDFIQSELSIAINQRNADYAIEQSDSDDEGTPIVTRSKRKHQKKVAPNKSKNKKPEPHDYKCFICSEVFDLIATKDLHIKKDHASEKICSICSKKKQTPIALENHLRFHFFGYRFLCPTCGRSFKYKNLLENHLRVEHGTIRFVCDLCLYSTKFKINLERHVKSVHLKLKNFHCQSCENHEYSTQVGLNLHMYRIHNVEPPVKCLDCLQGFTFDSELRVHKKHCTGNTIRKSKTRPQDSQVDVLEEGSGFRCRVCQQIYETRSKWSVHFSHKHKNSNVCSICNKAMASSTSLYKHIQVTHSGIKRFVCSFVNCKRVFGFKHSLEAHQNTHTGE